MKAMSYELLAASFERFATNQLAAIGSWLAVFYFPTTTFAWRMILSLR